MPIHRPPGLGVTTTVDGTLTRDGDVSHLVAIDAWRIVPASQTFPRGTDEWVEIGIESEFQRRTFLENEVDMTFHFDGTCVPGSFRYNYLTATFSGYQRDESVDSLLVLGCRRIGLGTKRRDDKLALMKLRL